MTPLHDGLPGETITVVEGLEGCHSANISPDNRTLWVPALKQDRICLFTLSDDGFLSAQEPAEVRPSRAPVRVTWYSIPTSSMVTASMS